jgi:hypothetical protein
MEQEPRKGAGKGARAARAPAAGPTGPPPVYSGSAARQPIGQGTWLAAAWDQSGEMTKTESWPLTSPAGKRSVWMLT